MTIFGVGPLILLVGIVSALLVAALQYGFQIECAYVQPGHGALLASGLALVSAGVVLWVLSLTTLVRRFRLGQLMTGGVYRLCRNPMYAAIIVLILPGTSLVCNNVLILLADLLTSVAFRILVRREERYLLATFGDDYTRYCQRVAQLIPFVRL
jgi:protein-S-isoprenylcysteine O-methyltransferase Ste14